MDTYDDFFLFMSYVDVFIYFAIPFYLAVYIYRCAHYKESLKLFLGIILLTLWFANSGYQMYDVVQNGWYREGSASTAKVIKQDIALTAFLIFYIAAVVCLETRLKPRPIAEKEKRYSGDSLLISR